MKNNPVHNDPFTRVQALKSALLISLTVNAILIMGIIYNDFTSPISVVKGNIVSYALFFLLQLACNLLLYLLLFLYCFRLVRRKQKSRYTAFKAIAGIILICLVLSPLLTQCQLQVFDWGDGKGMAEFTLFNLIKDLIVSVVIILLTETIHQGYKREQANLINQQLIAENIKVKYEALKNQLDPHFLFNSLNTLNGLIDMDEDKAHEYVDNLSSVFRYTLHSKNIVRLEEEMEFTDAYISLLQIRFGENFRVDYDINDKYRDHFIMPVSIQLLIENAVKHNVIHNRSPLVVKIATNDRGNIVVSNHINPKPEKGIGGVGLVNLTERYRILFGKDIEIRSTGGIFSVEIPLISEIDKTIHI